MIRKEVIRVDDPRAVSEAAVDVSILIGGRSKLGKSSRLLLRRFEHFQQLEQGRLSTLWLRGWQVPIPFRASAALELPRLELIAAHLRGDALRRIGVNASPLGHRPLVRPDLGLAGETKVRPRDVAGREGDGEARLPSVGVRGVFRASALGFSVGVRLLEEGERDVRLSVFRHRLDKVERV